MLFKKNFNNIMLEFFTPLHRFFKIIFFCAQTKQNVQNLNKQYRSVITAFHHTVNYFNYS